MKSSLFNSVIFVLGAAQPALAGVSFFFTSFDSDAITYGNSWSGPAWEGQKAEKGVPLGSSSAVSPLWGMSDGQAITNDRLRPFGFEVYSASGAGFHYDRYWGSIMPNDLASNVELRFTQPVRACWLRAKTFGIAEVRLGDALVATGPYGLFLAASASDPSFQFDRVILKPYSFPGSVPSGLISYLSYVALPAPGAAPLLALGVAALAGGRRRR